MRDFLLKTAAAGVSVLISCFTGTASDGKYSDDMIGFALAELAEADPGNSYTLSLGIDSAMGKEAYEASVSEDRCVSISGGDSTALMYAILDMAERLSFGEDLVATGSFSGKPYILNRGIKLNIPLDGRIPSFDDTGDAAQQNIAVMWEWDYWKNLLDDMARNRYNLLTLWSTNPFPAMVRVPEYPDIYIDDVCRYTGEITPGTSFFWDNEDIGNPEKLDTLLRIGIDDKIKFWQKVFRYAGDRGISVHLYTWNIFPFAAEGKHGITSDQNNPATADYFRKSVKAFLKTYPMIKGIGVTAGEKVNRETKGRYATENWLWETYGQGIMDARYENPELDVRFIFRQHWSDWSYIDDAFRYYDGPIEASFKYSRARMFSSTTPPWFDHIFRESVEKYGIRCWFNVRNDDLLNYRWGNPEYASEYLRNMPKELSPGYFVGSDGYIWGRVFSSKDPALEGTYEFRKHWYNFMIWGRCGYDPGLGTDFFISRLHQEYPYTDSRLLYDTWKATSEIVEWVDKLYFRQNDHMFSMEACMGNINYVTRFTDIEELIATGSMPEQGVISIANFAKGILDEGDISPLDVAERLDEASRRLLEGASGLSRRDGSAEYREMLTDFKAMAYLGKYYADKFRAATYVALYRTRGLKEYKTKAIVYAGRSVKDWAKYSEISQSAYEPQLLSRVSYLDWDKTMEEVSADVETARNAEYGDTVPQPRDNRLWKESRNRI